MKKSNKPIQKIKNNIPGFVTGILMCSIVGVAAVTYFPSNSVTYSNTSSGLKATDVQSAIDELYNTCFPPGPLDGTIFEDKVVTSGDGLYKDEYEDRYFYRGANPNNYITFNSETWRIVSIESDGTIKIIKEASIGDIQWGGNNNNWSHDGGLNYFLNNSYLTGMLNLTAQNQISLKSWSIGGVIPDNNNLADQINDENRTKWSGKIGLITVSEYIRSNSNQNTCGTFSKINNNSNSCKNTNWMYLNDHWWTMTAYEYTNDEAYEIIKDGSIFDYSVEYDAAVRPAVYLSSDIKITGGDGSLSNPYTIT